jgi:hypothetical protein
MGTLPRFSAFVAGIIASAGALAILLQDAFKTGAWGLEHVLMPVLVSVTILAGHPFGCAVRSRKLLSALGFLIVAGAATWGVVYTSVGKQSELAETRIKAAESVNAERASLLARRAKNAAMLEHEQELLARECASGKGTRCDRVKTTVGVYKDAVAGIDAKLEKLGPDLPIAPKAEKMAEVIAAFTGKDSSQVKHALMLVEPFTYSLIFELCALVSFWLEFGHGPNRSPNSQPNRSEPIGSPNRQQKSPQKRQISPNRSEPNRPAKRARSTKEEALASLLTDLALGRGFGSQGELAERFGRSKSTVSEWLAEWTKAGLIPKRTVRGRCKTICTD